MSKKPTAIIVCPGRGTYNAEELGYLNRYHNDKTDFVGSLDELRKSTGQKLISELDQAESFKMSVHGTGENASLLIFGCAVADFMDAQEHYDIVAVTGNSMGWYLSLACAGAMSMNNAAKLVNHMGTLMHQKGEGGQIVYPLVDDEWNLDPERVALVENVMSEARIDNSIRVETSIRLGGLIVFAADKAGLNFLMEKLPTEGRYPMPLNKHSAFHSSILDHIVPMAQSALKPDLFHKPTIPMVDGRGHIWSPYSTDVQELYEYTLGTQINKTYDFSAAVEVAVKEFAPDRIIVTGPGTTMGAPVAQTLIDFDWHGVSSKSQFKEQQSENPYILSMGMEEQRALLGAENN